MNAYPLETPLNQLSPARRVYIVRRGLVFLYPASIVRDIANDRYTMDDDRPWVPLPTDWLHGELLARQVGLDQVAHQYLRVLASAIWQPQGQPVGFDLWWESVNPDAHPEWIGAAAAVAARESMPWPLFQHRHMVDDLHTLP